MEMCAILCFGLPAGATIAAGPTGPGNRNTPTPAPSPPMTRPADPYQVAGAARRAAGIETWMFIHPTWINWRAQQFTSRQARELIDGYLLVMADQRGCQPADGATAASRILAGGMRLIPGMRLSPRAGYHGWTDPAAWLRELAFYDRVRQEFRLSDSAPFVLDTEPYWQEEPRYPRADDVYAMSQAMGPWLEIARRVELWILPGGAQYWNSWVLASIRARQGPVHLLDEATYTRCGGDDGKLEVMIRQRAALLRELGMEYVPGFYLRYAIDPGLYETLEKCRIQRCWFFCHAIDDEWQWFGTGRWRHCRSASTTQDTHPDRPRE